MSNHAPFPLHVGDFEKDAGYLPNFEAMAYLRLLARYWIDEEPLRDDDRWLAMVSHCRPYQWRRIRDRVLAFFVPVDGRLYHKRVEHELAKLLAKRERADHRRQRQPDPRSPVALQKRSGSGRKSSGIKARSEQIGSRATPSNHNYPLTPLDTPSPDPGVKLESQPRRPDPTPGARSSPGPPVSGLAGSEAVPGSERLSELPGRVVQLAPPVKPPAASLRRDHPEHVPRKLGEVLDRLLQHAPEVARAATSGAGGGP